MSEPGGRTPRLGGVYLASAVSLAIIAMKVVPWVPGSFTHAEWIAFGLWAGLGLAFWTARTRRASGESR
jgi:hypothetical protein